MPASQNPLPPVHAPHAVSQADLEGTGSLDFNEVLTVMRRLDLQPFDPAAEEMYRAKLQSRADAASYAAEYDFYLKGGAPEQMPTEKLAAGSAVRQRRADADGAAASARSARGKSAKECGPAGSLRVGTLVEVRGVQTRPVT